MLADAVLLSGDAIRRHVIGRHAARRGYGCRHGGRGGFEWPLLASLTGKPLLDAAFELNSEALEDMLAEDGVLVGAILLDIAMLDAELLSELIMDATAVGGGLLLLEEAALNSAMLLEEAASWDDVLFDGKTSCVVPLGEAAEGDWMVGLRVRNWKQRPVLSKIPLWMRSSRKTLPPIGPPWRTPSQKLRVDWVGVKLRLELERAEDVGDDDKGEMLLGLEVESTVDWESLLDSRLSDDMAESSDDTLGELKIGITDDEAGAIVLSLGEMEEVNADSAVMLLLAAPGVAVELLWPGRSVDELWVVNAGVEELLGIRADVPALLLLGSETSEFDKLDKGDEVVLGTDVNERLSDSAAPDELGAVRIEDDVGSEPTAVEVCVEEASIDLSDDEADASVELAPGLLVRASEDTIDNCELLAAKEPSELEAPLLNIKFRLWPASMDDIWTMDVSVVTGPFSLDSAALGSDSAMLVDRLSGIVGNVVSVDVFGWVGDVSAAGMVAEEDDGCTIESVRKLEPSLTVESGAPTGEVGAAVDESIPTVLGPARLLL